jgi:AcrR family transcriptional regulator
MPSETYHHLTKEKRDMIMNAAKVEFALYKLHEAKISRIIKSAGIPRGSFYQYFDSLEDVYCEVMKDMTDMQYMYLHELLNETTDIFEYMIKSFELDYDFLTQPYHSDLTRNMLINLALKFDSINASPLPPQYILDEIISGMENRSTWLTPNEFKEVFMMIMHVKQMVLRETIIQNISKLDGIKRFKMLIDFIKNGVLKN